MQKARFLRLYSVTLEGDLAEGSEKPELGIEEGAARLIIQTLTDATTMAPAAFRSFASQMMPPPPPVPPFGASTQIVPSSQPSSQTLVLPFTQAVSARFGNFAMPPSQVQSQPDPSQSGQPAQADQATASSSSVVAQVVHERLSFHAPGLDALTGGGLLRGHILEISGAPNTPRELVSMGAARSALSSGGAVLWVDTQNLTKPYDLDEYFSKCPEVSEDYLDRIHYLSIQRLPQLLILLHNLLKMTTPNSSAPTPQFGTSSGLGTEEAPTGGNPRRGVQSLDPPPTLLVISSVAFPFQSHPNISYTDKAKIYERIRTLLSRACALADLSVSLGGR